MFLEASGESSKPSGLLVSQLDTLRSIARMFRAAINRRQTVHKNVNQESTIAPEIQEDNIEALSFNETSLTNTTTLSPAEIEKSIRNMDAMFTSIRDVYSVIRNGLRRYEITDTDCQSRIVCEIHQKIISRNKMLKTFSLNAIDVLR